MIASFFLLSFFVDNIRGEVSLQTRSLCPDCLLVSLISDLVSNVKLKQLRWAVTANVKKPKKKHLIFIVLLCLFIVHSCLDYRQVSNECGRQCGGNTLIFGKVELVIYMGFRTIRLVKA